MIWANHGDNSGEDGRGGAGEMWLDYGYVLKVYFKDEFDVDYESKRKANDDSIVLVE